MADWHREAIKELELVCDAYGLPYSPVALDRHLRGQWMMEVGVVKMQVTLLEKRIAELEADRDRLREALREHGDGCIRFRGDELTVAEGLHTPDTNDL